MSWLERISTEILITTGDGRQYSPFWVNANKSQEYNLNEFEFVDVAGALVVRKEPKARKFPIEIIFQGDDNIDQAEAFEVSARDNRAWEVQHPLYGSIFCQPSSLTFDNSKFNISRITGTLIETILEDAPRGTTDPKDQINADAETTSEALGDAYADNVTPDTSDINLLQDNNQTAYDNGKVLVKTDEESDAYFNAFNEANAAILNATSEPLAAIRGVQAVITVPSLFEQSVRARLRMFRDNINALRVNVPTTTKKSEKITYENNAGACVVGMAISAANPLESDYKTADEAFAMADIILAAYNLYIADLDSLQSDNGGQVDSYIPNSAALQALASLIDFTLNNLFKIALDSKQERFIFVEKDTNVIELAHRFYGLNVDDTTIDDVINQNEISLHELLIIRKGRRIVYYV